MSVIIAYTALSLKYVFRVSSDNKLSLEVLCSFTFRVNKSHKMLYTMGSLRVLLIHKNVSNSNFTPLLETFFSST